MRPWRCPPPTYALHEAPALAAVDVAGIVLWLVVAALRAAHPELRDGTPTREAARPCGSPRP